MSTSPATTSVDATSRLLGTTVASKYRIDRLLGRGGMGAVFQATNTAIKKRVALKFLSEEAARDAQAAERFQREAEAASLVESEHIVQIFDVGSTEEGVPFLVMELLSGRDLRAELKLHERLAVERAGLIAVQVLRALVRAHEAGIVHRDLKPDNVFLCERDRGEAHVKIVDFGISKLAKKNTHDTLTKRGTILGTASYMSPEQAQGLEEVDARTDLYAVGAILYEMLSGRPPHVAPTYEAVLVAICTRDADDVRVHHPDVPAAVARVVRKALTRDRERRYQSAGDMLAALEAALSGESDLAPLSSPPEVAAKPTPSLRPGRHRTLVTAIVALLFGFALTALLLSQRRQNENTAAALPEPAENVAPTAAADTLASAGTEAEAPPFASAAPSSTTEPTPAPVSVKGRSKSPAATATPRKRPATAPRPTSGVAAGLELNTSGP